MIQQMRKKFSMNYLTFSIDAGGFSIYQKSRGCWKQQIISQTGPAENLGALLLQNDWIM